METTEHLIKTYENGLRLVVAPMANFKSVAFSLMVTVGSGDEQKNEQGLSHFCEHMLFKGTHKRSGQQIIDELSQLSVDYNAWTSESATCYHTKGVATNLEQCVDILADMYFNLDFQSEDFDKEGDVIVQEIAMHEDRPTSVLYDKLNAAFFKGTKYEHPVAGYAAAIKGYQPQDIYNYIRKHYTAPNTIIAFAGAVTFAQAEALVAKYFLPYLPNTPAQPKVRENLMLANPEIKRYTKKKDTEQQHVALAWPICNQFSQERYAFDLLSLLFGGDMSSRLFIQVREKLGLVYSVYANVELSDIGGYFYVGYSCTPPNTDKVVSVVQKEIAKIMQDGITQKELEKARNFLHTRKLFDSEYTTAVNAHLARELADYNAIKTTAEELQAIDAVTVDDINQLVKKYLQPEKMLSVVVGK